MSTQQWAQLQAAVAHVGDPHLITAQACFDLARTLGIEYENVGVGWGRDVGGWFQLLFLWVAGVYLQTLAVIGTRPQSA